MARLTEAQKRKARNEFERRQRSSSDSSVTSSTSFDSWLPTFIATVDSSASTFFDTGSSSSSCDTSSYSDGGSSSSCDAGSF